MSDPTDLFSFDEINKALKTSVELEADLRDTLDFVGGAASPGDAPVLRLIQSLSEDAVQVGALDIHIGAQEGMLQIRCRSGGVLHQQAEVDVKIAPAVALRLKIMSGLETSGKRLPQDRRFNVRVRDQWVDVRISARHTRDAVGTPVPPRGHGRGALNGDEFPARGADAAAVRGEA